jgi:hypothetical protein
LPGISLWAFSGIMVGVIVCGIVGVIPPGIFSFISQLFYTPKFAHHSDPHNCRVDQFLLCIDQKALKGDKIVT